MQINTLFIRRNEDPEASSVLRLARSFGYSQATAVQIERAARIEGDVDPRELHGLFANPLYEKVAEVSFLDPADGPIIEVAYQLAVVDPETPSIFDAVWALGIKNLRWVRLARRYQLVGLSDEEAKKMAGEFLYNPVVQEIIPADKIWESLYPHGTPDPLKTISLNGQDNAALRKLSSDKRWNAPLSQMKAIQLHEVEINRPHTDAEIEMIVQWWCDHCYHTTWKSLGLLKILQDATNMIAHPDVVSAYSDNAGGFDFYDDLVALIKGETHNHPSAIATLGGILTKHGGVIRDIIFFGRGGYPIGGTTIMGIMDPRIKPGEVPTGALHPRRILIESIAGTAGYLNPVGIPMMQALYRIHYRFTKCFALGHTVGIIPEKYALKKQPQKGDLIFLIGGRTGRDGIHGATGSSGELTVEVLQRFAAEVQIGHPITERKFMTAMPVLRDANCIRTCTDLGAGGISCAVGEIVEDVGGTIDISVVPLKDNSLADWEILLSESQERGVLIVPAEKKEEAIRILNLYEVEFCILGEITGDNILTVKNGERLVAQFDLDFVWKGCPIDKAEVRRPKRKLLPTTRAIPQTAEQWQEATLKVLGHFHCADQSAAIFQYDQTVQGTTVIGPLGGINGRMPNNLALKAPLRGKPYGLGLSLGWKPFYGELDPAKMVELAHLEAVSYPAALGASIRDMFAHSNYYTPKLTPEVGWDLKEMVKAQARTNISLGIPTIAGKDSSSGTWVTKDGRRIDVPHTCVMAIAFKMPDVATAVTKPFKKADNSLVWVGPCNPDALGGSVYLDCYGERGDILPGSRIEEYKLLYETLHAVYQKCPSAVVSATAIGDGGLFIRLYEMAYGSGLGAYTELSLINMGRPDGVLFGEHIGSILLEVNDADISDFNKACFEEGLPIHHIGVVMEAPKLQIEHRRNPILNVEVAELAQTWERTFTEVV